jgi:hypothetical protein
LALREGECLSDSRVCAAATEKKSRAWIAEALNEATSSYFSAFALAQAGTPSEQVKWVRELRIAADTCLRMLAPSDPAELDLSTARPRVADHRVHSALFHWGEPSVIEAGPGHAAQFDYDPIRDALDQIPGKLWDLRRMAQHAEEQWREVMIPRNKRRVANKAVLSWVSHLADIYWRIFGVAAPNLPKPGSPFGRFADAARRVAITASVTDHGTDDDARARLEKLEPKPLSSFMREHRPELAKRLASARKRRYVPERIKLGIVSETGARVGK